MKNSASLRKGEQAHRAQTFGGEAGQGLPGELGPPRQGVETGSGQVSGGPPFIPKSVFQSLSDAKKTSQTPSAREAADQPGGSSRRDGESLPAAGRLCTGQFQMEAGHELNPGGSVAYLRDTVNDQNQPQIGLDYELMANPVELATRAGGRPQGASFQPEEFKASQGEPARRDTSFEMGSLPSSEDSGRSTHLKDDME